MEIAARLKEKGKSRSAQKSAAGSGSSAGSITSDNHSSAGPSAGPSHSTQPSVDHSIFSQESDSSDRTVVSSALHRRIDKSPAYDFGAQAQVTQPDTTGWCFQPPSTGGLGPFVRVDGYSRRLFLWGRAKNTSAPGRPLKDVYQPQWPVANPSERQSEEKGNALDTLSSSFHDVGLQPAIGENRGSGRYSKRK